MHLKPLQFHLFIYQHQTTEILLSILMRDFCLFLCTGNRNILKCLPRELSRNPTNILAVILGGILIIFPSRDFATLLFEYLVRKMQPGQPRQQWPPNTLYKIAKANQTFSNQVNQDNHLFRMKNSFPS